MRLDGTRDHRHRNSYIQDRTIKDISISISIIILAMFLSACGSDETTTAEVPTLELAEIQVDGLQDSDFVPRSDIDWDTALFSAYAATAAYEDQGFSFEDFATKFDYTKIVEIDEGRLVLDPDGIQGLSNLIVVDLQAYVYKQWTYIDGRFRWHLLIAFRGTAEREDVVTDAQALLTTFSSSPDTKVHRGFWASMDVFRELALEEPTYLELSQDPDTRFLIVGHSLGGAIAELYAAKLIAEGLATKQQIDVYTIGQPATGDAAYVETYKEAFYYHRLYQDDDPILFTATDELGYLDEGISVGSADGDIGDGHSSLTYIQSIKAITEEGQDGQ